ncbi:SDR family oxidoreductase [Mangrovitalea sediminis]|uniref:SDR family oxidoreductase n=1 Tax=Mangrovitalea sediminis TaxID=1982043 RepID=UPI000BE56A7B|nr:SDR family oxidoreductase [Mangrovitalea sediminis]
MALEQQKIVVMGGSSGVGLSAVARFAKAGAEVIAVARNADRLASAIEGLPGRVGGIALDGTDREALDDFFTTLGNFDHLVLTLSGGEGAGEFATLDLAALRRGFEAKFWPQLEVAQASLPWLRKGGSITFVTAISARIANPGTSGLAAINGALESMIGTLARELGPVRVNAVSPGVIDTPWWNAVPADFKAAVFQQQAEALPVGRVGRPDEVAQAIEFLVGNGFTTGTVLPCDGGLSLL